ncbi:hypothetical protein [Streptomyces sp. NPDC003032]
MLTSLLPGFRHFRTPFAVGTLWAFQVWVLFGEWIPAKSEAQGFIKRLYALGDLAGRPVTAAAIVFALYVLGDIVKVSAARIAARINALRPSMRTALLTRQSYHELHLFAETLRSRVGETFDLMAAMSAVMREFPEIRMRLIANHLDVYLEHDRLDSEAEFRVNLAAYSVTLWVMLAVLWSPWWLFGFTASVMLALNGFRALRGANGVLVQSLASGIVESRVYSGHGHHHHSHSDSN